LFPVARLGLELFAPAASETVEARLAVILGGAPRRRDRALLLQLQEDRIERSLVDEKLVSADLLNPPRDSIAVQGPSTWSVLSTISASVPCRTSFLSFASLIGFPTGSMSYSVLENNRKVSPLAGAGAGFDAQELHWASSSRRPLKRSALGYLSNAMAAV